MRALILSGGAGRRLELGEKPLVNLCGKPMLEWVIEAFTGAGCEITVVLSRKTPYTHNWCRVHGIDHYTAAGAGYIEDIVETITVLEEKNPFFTAVSDIPCLRPEHVVEIRERYLKSGEEACSVWIPLSLFTDAGCCPSYSEEIDGIRACPAGVNILRGDIITRPQKECRILLFDEYLAFNINTRAELEILRSTLRDRSEYH